MDENGPGIDAEGAREFLSDRFGREVPMLTPLSGGAWSQAFAYRDENRDRVVRFSALDDDFRKDEIASRYASPGLPIPRVLEIGVAPSGFYAISERVHGNLLEDADGPQMTTLVPSVMETLDALRLADVGGTSGYGLWRADGNAPYRSWPETLLDVATDRLTERGHGWRQRLGDSPTGDAPFTEAHRRLATLAAVPAGDRHLIHSDLLHGNVLVEGDRITGVLDWGSAMYGDFLFDLAWITFWSAWYQAWGDIDFRSEATRHFTRIGLDVPHFHERLRACELYVGLSGQAYQASRGFWSDLESTAARTLDLARRDVA